VGRGKRDVSLQDVNGFEWGCWWRCWMRAMLRWRENRRPCRMDREEPGREYAEGSHAADDAEMWIRCLALSFIGAGERL